MAIIRSLLTRKPDLTGVQIQSLLANSPQRPIALDIKYLYKLLKKIRVQRAKRIELYTMNEVLGRFSDEAEELKQRLWGIILNEDTKDKDVISAVKELRNTTKELFDKMFESGLFEKSLGKLKLEHELSDEDREIVQTALENAFGNRTTK